MREVQALQKSSDLIIPRSCFEKLVHEIIKEHMYKEGIFMKRIQRQALEALQEVAEHHVLQQLEMGQMLAIHAKHITLQSCDLVMAKKIKEY